MVGGDPDRASPRQLCHRPDGVVRQPVIGRPVFPSPEAQAARDPAAFAAHPERCFAVEEQGMDDVGRQAAGVMRRDPPRMAVPREQPVIGLREDAATTVGDQVDVAAMARKERLRLAGTPTTEKDAAPGASQARCCRLRAQMVPSGACRAVSHVSAGSPSAWPSTDTPARALRQICWPHPTSSPDAPSAATNPAWARAGMRATVAASNTGRGTASGSSAIGTASTTPSAASTIDPSLSASELALIWSSGRCTEATLTNAPWLRAKTPSPVESQRCPARSYGSDGSIPRAPAPDPNWAGKMRHRNGTGRLRCRPASRVGVLADRLHGEIAEALLGAVPFEADECACAACVPTRSVNARRASPPRRRAKGGA